MTPEQIRRWETESGLEKAYLDDEYAGPPLRCITEFARLVAADVASEHDAARDSLSRLQQTWAENAPAVRYKRERDELAAALRELRYRAENFHLYLEGEHGVKLSDSDYDDHNVSEYFAAIQDTDTLLARIDSEAKP